MIDLLTHNWHRDTTTHIESKKQAESSQYVILLFLVLYSLAFIGIALACVAEKFNGVTQ
jgi:hypothetical protein